ncbi:hypothetical protein SBA4_7350007 [Candidatus Sulfopaludibacter sp. SbA4]|nr:hypothetical protein SBA4_7350007 [Candidatus Sulfopaludibacter sp. SbA4]
MRNIENKCRLKAKDSALGRFFQFALSRFCPPDKRGQDHAGGQTIVRTALVRRCLDRFGLIVGVSHISLSPGQRNAKKTSQSENSV